MVASSHASASPDVLSYLLQGGPFAIVVLLVVMEKLVTPGERNRIYEVNQILREELRKTNEDLRQEIVPPITQIVQLVPEMIRVIGNKKAGD